jgi:hypothetical protein
VAQDHGARRVEPGIEIDRGDHRLHRIGEQRLLAAPAGQHLGPAQAQHGAEVDLARDLGAGLACGRAR